jgi:cbb3-type cytochrome oxidase subunit 3
MRTLLPAFPYMSLSIAAMLLFFVVYLGWSWYALNRRQKPRFDALSKLPLED